MSLLIASRLTLCLQILIRSGFCCLALVFFNSQACALNTALAPGRYADIMEFYYKKPQPDLLKPMLRSFADAGWLNHAETRLSVAAFLAELARNGRLNLRKFSREIYGLGHNARITLAWAFHLSGLDKTPAKFEKLLSEEDKRLAAQIQESPAHLKNWDPAAESSVLGMYWSAFMASGNLAYIDAIIAQSLNLRNFKAAEKAAASLYDYAPRHEKVSGRIRDYIRKAKPNAKERLKTMLGE